MIEVSGVLWAVVVFGGWFLAAGAALILATGHPRPDRSGWWYMWNGWAFYSAANFAPSGAGVHRAFLLGVVLFVLGLGSAMVAAALAS
jgi:hypothetical protein